MKTLKEQILELKATGIPQNEIARQLDCSSGTVSYHCSPTVRSNAAKLRRKSRLKNKKINPLLDKEIDIEIKPVDWRVAEALCIAKMIELGYDTFLPFTDGSEIDLIAHKDGKILRIQVKSTTPVNKNCITVGTMRKTSTYKKIDRKPYKYIDLILIYDGNNIYRIDFTGENTITLRYRVPSNGQIADIKMASDYII